MASMFTGQYFTFNWGQVPAKALEINKAKAAAPPGDLQYHNLATGAATTSSSTETGAPHADSNSGASTGAIGPGGATYPAPGGALTPPGTYHPIM
jgi:hypothetical protein